MSASRPFRFLSSSRCFPAPLRRQLRQCRRRPRFSSGQQEDQQIVASSVIETDPLLNAYVQGIAGNLWNQVARKDVPYSVKIIKDRQHQLVRDDGRFRLRLRRFDRLRSVGRRASERHRPRDRPHRAPPRDHHQLEGARSSTSSSALLRFSRRSSTSSAGWPRRD